MAKVKYRVSVKKGKSGTKLAAYTVKARKSNKPQGKLLFAPEVEIGLDIKHDGKGRPRKNP